LHKIDEHVEKVTNLIVSVHRKKHRKNKGNYCFKNCYW